VGVAARILALTMSDKPRSITIPEQNENHLVVTVNLVVSTSNMPVRRPAPNQKTMPDTVLALP